MQAIYVSPSLLLFTVLSSPLPVIFVCPSCTQSTGQRSVSQYILSHTTLIHPLTHLTVDWEGPDALEPYEPSDPESDDDYVEQDKPKRHGKVYDPFLSPFLALKYSYQRPVRRLSLSSESDASTTTTTTTNAQRRNTTKSTSRRTTTKPPLPASPTSPRPLLKRKQHAPPPPLPTPKRKKSDVPPISAADDPTRKYCLGKLQEVFNQIFLNYPYLRSDSADHKLVEKSSQDLTDAERTYLVEQAQRFATDLEQCLYDIYAEPDNRENHLQVVNTSTSPPLSSLPSLILSFN